MATKQKEINKIIHGDCVKTLAKLPAGSVDLAFADPPFNIGYDYDEYSDDLSCNDYLNWSRDWIKGVVRVLKPNGTFWLAIGDEYAAELKVIATRELGLTCRSWVIWYYTFGVHCTHKFTRSHAHMFHFVKDPKDHTFNADEIRVPSARQLVYGDKRANPKGRVPDDTWIIEPPAGLPPIPSSTSRADQFLLRPQDVPDGFSADSDTWYFPRVCGTFKQRKGFHGCQMPEQLLGRIIKACSNRGDTVLDPFTGSGTTLAVAKKLNRNYLGTELSKEYATESKKRLAAIKPGDPLDGKADPLASAPKTSEGTIMTATGERVKSIAKEPKVLASASRSSSAIPTRLRAQISDLDDLSRGVVEAFATTHRGYSIDWTLASRELNQGFVAECQRLSLPSDPTSWNARLLRLRKAKKLSGMESKRPPRLNQALLRACEFGSEIAWIDFRRTLGVTLDQILCDPGLANRFDALAERLAPGNAPEYYRWAALSMRKRRKNSYQAAIESIRAPSLPGLGTIRRIDLKKIPAAPGVYMLTSAFTSTQSSQALYVGESANLREWLEIRLAEATFAQDPFTPFGGERIQLHVTKRTRSTQSQLRNLQWRLAIKKNAYFNLTKTELHAA